MTFSLDRSLDRAKGVVLIAGLVIGLGMSVGGCNGPIKRMREMKNRGSEPVNTGLSVIPSEPELKLPRDEELMSRDDDDFGSVRAQIEESARQLNVYFANLEIDGIGDGQVVAVEPVEPMDVIGNKPSAREPMEVVIEEPVEISQGASDSSSTASRGSDVRVSLLGNSGSVSRGGISAEHFESASDADAELQAELVASPMGVADGVAEVEVVSVDPQVRKAELARELASILATLASTSDDPGSAALALASVEILLPEGAGPLFDQGVLSDAERTSLEAARSFLRSLSSEGAIASPSEVASELEAIQAQLDAWAGLTIRKAVLCTRVDGYGWYETFPSYRFVAGRAQPVIVYVELDRFAQREVMGPDGQLRYQTKLSQRLELYHIADDLNTWNRQAETVTGETRNRLRDYYLTNQVTLPASLGVGRYHLKVVMRDFIGERVAEAIIPIEIVAR